MIKLFQYSRRQGGLFILLFLFMGVTFVQSGFAWAGAAPTGHCRMTTTFPDQSVFAEDCVVTLLKAGESLLAPKGMMEFMDPNNQNHLFSLLFFPPAEIKVNVPYTLASDTRESFLNGIVQQLANHERCNMNKNFSTHGTVTFTMAGPTNSDFHGTLQVYPACYVDLGTPNQRLVPGGQVGGGTIVISF